MIYRHKFLKRVFLEEKEIKKITPEKPLIFIVQESAFLHYTICSALKYLDIPHVITTLKASDLEDSRKCMGHQVPCLVYDNIVLETNQLIEFLSDAFNEQDEFIDFESRKALLKQTALLWKQIFIFEKLWPYDFPKLSKFGVNNKSGYQTLVIEQLKNLHINYHEKIIKKTYSKFSEQVPSFELILFVDIIKCILEYAPESFLDFVLRRFFPNLIQIEERFEKMIQRSEPRFRVEDHQIVLESSEQIQEPKFQKFRTNSQRFLLVFGFLTTIYGVFAKS